MGKRIISGWNSGGFSADKERISGWAPVNKESMGHQPGHKGLQSEAAAKYADITYKVIGAAMRVHNELGPGLKEAIYQAALSAAMREAGLGFEEEYPVQVTLEGEQVGLLYLDHLVEDVVAVEEKALSHLVTNDDVAQVVTYLKATGKPLGLLFNFGRRKLEYRRILPPKTVQGSTDRLARYAWVPSDVQAQKNHEAHPLIRSISAEKPSPTNTKRPI